jgi:hypothetical protein
MWFVPLFAADLVLWMLAQMFAPVGYRVSFGRLCSLRS